MNNFKTVSSPKKNLETIAMTFAVAVVLAAYGLTVTVAFWIFLEVLLLTVFAIMFFMVNWPLLTKTGRKDTTKK